MNATAILQFDMPVKRLYTRKQAMDFLALTPDQWYKVAAPYLTKISIPSTKTKCVFCFYELNALADKIKAASERPPEKELDKWDSANRPDSPKSEAPGISIRSSREYDFTEVTKLLRSRRQ